MYTYEGDDLGATFATKQTRFNVWAPLASSVQLIIQHQGRMMTYPMQRDLQGVYRCVLEGNYEKALYRYEVTNSGIARVAVDPYAKGSTQNGEWSVVINFHAFPASPWLLKSPTLKQYTDAIIYETSVRDLTSDRLTNIVHKGRFLGLTESQATTSQGRPLGLDHLIKLGITHVQLLPIYDFKTVDEKDPHRFYNWGYDPAQYFVPEGSFASELEDPYSRIRDLKVLAATLHEHHIGVIMDVVFNHVYQFHLSNFEKVFNVDSNVTSLWYDFLKFTNSCPEDKCLYITSGWYDGHRNTILSELNASNQNRWSYDYESMKLSTQNYKSEIENLGIDFNSIPVISAKYFGWNLNHPAYEEISNHFYKEYTNHLQGNIILSYLSAIYKNDTFEYKIPNQHGASISQHKFLG
jgi:hypothetical protein